MIGGRRTSKQSSRIRSRQQILFHPTSVILTILLPLIRSLKRQLESRLRQLDRFEVSVKTATESQKQWRTRIQVKQTEIDAAKVYISSPTLNVVRTFSDLHHLFSSQLIPSYSTKSLRSDNNLLTHQAIPVCLPSSQH